VARPSGRASSFEIENALPDGRATAPRQWLFNQPLGAHFIPVLSFLALNPSIFFAVKGTE
ncbi:MAG TPA: hypothetical protein VGW36_00285, partial [Pyrinomonadaceae bacterium]|nr:hypothetical protein [Pyrinomonadaceae bacterium]